jgi:hypothetical protein
MSRFLVSSSVFQPSLYMAIWVFLVPGGMVGGSWGAPEVAVRLLRRDEMSGARETGREEGGDVWVGIVSCGAVV